MEDILARFHLAKAEIASILRTVTQALPRADLRASLQPVHGRPFSSRSATLSASSGAKILLEDRDNGFSFIHHNPRNTKLRKLGVTEIRGPYYSSSSTRHLRDVFGTMGYHVDRLKFAGGSFGLMPEDRLREIIELAHEHGIYLSTGGWMEHVLTQSDKEAAVTKYLQKCKDLGFDVIECSAGFLSFPGDDWVRLVDKVREMGLKAKPETGIQLGAGGYEHE